MGRNSSRREESWAGKVTQWEGCLFVVERIRGGRVAQGQTGHMQRNDGAA
jgi:hypothetical protein